MLTLPVVFCTRLSNLILSGFKLRGATTVLFRLCCRMEHKLATSFDSLKELALYLLFIQLPLLSTSKLCELERLCNTLDTDSTNVFDKILVPFCSDATLIRSSVLR